MSFSYTQTKVHNEVVFCTVYDEEKKALIEKHFLKNRISYYETWEKVNFFLRLLGKKQGCQICVNAMQVELAEEIFKKLELTDGNGVSIEKRPVEKTYF